MSEWNQGTSGFGMCQITTVLVWDTPTTKRHGGPWSDNGKCPDGKMLVRYRASQSNTDAEISAKAPWCTSTRCSRLFSF